MTNNRAKVLEAFDYAIERITEASKGNGGLVYDAALNAYFMLKDHGKKIREALSEPKWKSMDSAPRDKGYIIGINMRGKEAGEPFIMRNTFIADEIHDHAHPEACWAEKGHDWPSYPTHWMHLPDAPTGGES